MTGLFIVIFFFFQAEDGIRDLTVTGVQTCALPISGRRQSVVRDHADPAAGCHPVAGPLPDAVQFLSKGNIDDLERVGDHAVNIAQSAERLLPARLVAPEPELLDMARQARGMLSGALDAFVRGDAALGREICRRDDSVDALHRSVFRILLTHMMEDPHIIGAAMELFLVSRNLERVADLATNIARSEEHTSELQSQ